MQRIHILGASGSRVTTRGRALAEHLGCPHFDVDDYCWLPTDPPFQQIRAVPERQTLLRAGLERHGAWVLSGSLCGWGDRLIPMFDLVVFLWVPPATRIARLRERERRRFGDAALAPGGAMRETHLKFIDWAAGYDDGDLSMRSRRMHEEWLRSLPCPVLRVEGEEPVEERLAAVLHRLRVAS